MGGRAVLLNNLSGGLGVFRYPYYFRGAERVGMDLRRTFSRVKGTSDIVNKVNSVANLKGVSSLVLGYRC